MGPQWGKKKQLCINTLKIKVFSGVPNIKILQVINFDPEPQTMWINRSQPDTLQHYILHSKCHYAK